MFRVRFQHLLLRPSIWYWCEEEKWSVDLFTIFFLFAVHYFFMLMNLIYFHLVGFFFLYFIVDIDVCAGNPKRQLAITLVMTSWIISGGSRYNL